MGGARPGVTEKETSELPNQGRRAIGLAPDNHICVVKATDIVGVLPETLRRSGGSGPLTMISRLSATSDIEQERVEGVHGPRKLEGQPRLLSGRWWRTAADRVPFGLSC